VRLELTSPEDAERIAREDKTPGEQHPGRRTLDDFLALDPSEHPWVTRRWLVEGDPGSGKTTLLRHLAGGLARKGDRRRIPVFVSLPRLVEPFRLPLDYLAEEYGPLCGPELPGVLDAAGRDGRLLVLLDGLDEVRPERRDRVDKLLAKLDRDWPRSSVVLTSRPIGLGQPPPDFHKLLLQPFDDAQRRRFLEKWFRHREHRHPKAEAERAGAFYVTERWLGGLLTNFQTIKKNVRRLKDLERGVEEGAFEFYTKKERLLLDREREKLDRYLSGIKDMNRLPGLVFVVDATKEDIAVREANRLGIPVVAIADTNADPDRLTIAIAGNDDAIRSVSLITGAIADEILIARREAPDAAGGRDEGSALTYSSDVGGTEAADGKRKKRPKRRPRPELIKRRRHASDPEAGETGDEDSEDEANEEITEAGVSGADGAGVPSEEAAETEEVAVTAEAAAGEDGDGRDPGSP